jgi:hypothetical protein
MILKNSINTGFTLLLILLAASLSFGQTRRITLDEYIKTYKMVAVQEMQLYKIPASITLAQGILESGNGNSDLAVHANNHFGIKCKVEWTGEKYYHDDDALNECFRKYPTSLDSYRDHSVFLTTRDRYASLFQLKITDYKGWATGLKQAGYATDPTYAEELIKIIENNKLFVLDSSIDIVAKIEAKDSMKIIVPLQSKDTTNKAIHDDNPDFQDVILTESSRRIGQINGVRYIQARDKDSYTTIALDFGLTAKDIANYNDEKKDHAITDNEIVFIESKKEDGPVEFHKVVPGETLKKISQRYGMKLRSLCRKNHMKPGTEPVEGQNLYLQSTAPVY